MVSYIHTNSHPAQYVKTMNPAQLELLTEYLQRLAAQLDRIEMNLRNVTELVERVAGQPVPGERGLGH